MANLSIDTSAAAKAASSTSSKKTTGSDSLDKDAFLQLLVTQMQYQDPLQPTSNTEYMSQLAQFSTVEELQNLSTTSTTNQAMNLTGQYVILNVPDSSGEVKQISGLVDYVTITDGKAYFSINDQYYSADYLDSVVSIDYLKHLIENSDSAGGGTTGTDQADTSQAASGDQSKKDEDGSKTEGSENA